MNGDIVIMGWRGFGSELLTALARSSPAFQTDRRRFPISRRRSPRPGGSGAASSKPRVRLVGPLIAALARHGPAFDSPPASPASGLTGEDLGRVDLADARLDGEDFAGARLTGANLAGASLRGTRFAGADLSSALLVDADLDHADLRDADLSGADLTRAYLGDANLYGANLTGTDMSRADLRGAVLHGAVWSTETTWPARFAAEVRTRSVSRPDGTFQVADRYRRQGRTRY